MPTINQLPTVTQLSGGDQLPVYVSNQGDARRSSITTLISYVEANFANVVAQTVNTIPVTLVQLPTATVAGAGTRAFITDGSTTTFGATVSGGGANKVPIYSDGTNWKVG
jgi:hypothetical protein